ncbi:MAG: tRNA (adenosine(37)-N6)-threonylcarbamoyltransferase complex dimerization subunit type 1 TsaB [Actinomycetales bacterium]|nr:tRNA (adenosine(37)-N6)-threonylcarbamoyltransferase complex dimerization subunit type 1 TsaB [Actinomycetales bacterium]
MRVLAIDTSAGTSVAVVENNGGSVTVLGESSVDNAMKHAETIGSAIVDALAQAGLTGGVSTTGRVRGIDAVVVGRGPAPFTGLRVGIAAAVMFAEGLNLPLFGVVSHDAVALAEFERGLTLADGEELLVTSDARRSEVYWATYQGQNENGLPIRSAGPAVQKPADLDREFELAGRKLARASGQVKASSIAKIFFAQQASDCTDGDVSALYLRAPDAVPTAAKKVSG